MDKLVPRLRAVAAGQGWIDEMELLANAMDVALGGRRYRAAWQAASRLLNAPEQLPSARVLATMGTDFDGSYLRFTRAQSVQTRNLLLGLPWSEAQQRSFEAMARDSVLEQKRIEASDTMPFEIYRQEYTSPKRLEVRVPARDKVRPLAG